ncbi:MAG: VWA domain-containing protein, partial [Bryobacteraceae bacterium]
MNILDDPKLTAYALDELSGAEQAAMETTVAASPDAQECVREIRLLSGKLRAEYDAERETRLAAQSNIVLLAQEDEPWSISRRLALAAAIALCACLGAIAIGTMKRGGSVKGNGSGRLAGGPTITQLPAANNAAVDAIESAPEENEPPPPPAGATEFALAAPKARAKQESSGSANLADRSIRLGQQPVNTARYGEVNENSFLDAASNPLSTFSIDVDAASYSNVRRFLENGSLPPK